MEHELGRARVDGLGGRELYDVGRVRREDRRGGGAVRRDAPASDRPSVAEGGERLEQRLDRLRPDLVEEEDVDPVAAQPAEAALELAAHVRGREPTSGGGRGTPERLADCQPKEAGRHDPHLRRDRRLAMEPAERLLRRPGAVQGARCRST